MADRTDDEPLRLGGMALANGLLVHGPTSWSAAVRRRDGSLAVAGGTKPRLRGRAADLPGARGVLRLAEAMAVIPIVKRALPEAQLPFAGGRQAATMAGASLGASLLRRRVGGELGDAGALVLSLVPALAALRQGDVAAYHGAEHKTIGAYESGDQAVDATKEHDRCGSHLMTPLLASQLAGTALLRRAIGGARPSAAQAAAVQLAAVGVSVEVFGWSERNSDTVVARALRRPGHELQRLLGTREPTEAQLEVGRAALDEVLRRECAAA